MGGPQKEKNLEILTNEQRLGIFAWTLKHQRTIRVHNEGFSALEGVPKTALKWCLGTSYFFTFPSILAPASRLVYYVVVLAGRPGPPLHLIKSRNSSVQRGKRSSSTEKTLLIKLSDTILHYLHTDTHIKCAKKWLRQRRYFLGWKGIGIFLLMLGPSIY